MRESLQMEGCQTSIFLHTLNSKYMKIEIMSHPPRKVTAKLKEKPAFLMRLPSKTERR